MEALHPVPGRDRHQRRRRRSATRTATARSTAPTARCSRRPTWSTARTRAASTSTRGRSAARSYRLAYDDERRPDQRVPAVLRSSASTASSPTSRTTRWRRATSSSGADLSSWIGAAAGSLRPVIHLRIVVEPDRTERRARAARALALGLQRHLPAGRGPRSPTGDVILADVAREDASVVISDLKDLGVHHDGAITLEPIDTQISDHAERRRSSTRRARRPTPSSGRRSRRARARTSSSPASSSPSWCSPACSRRSASTRTRRS